MVYRGRGGRVAPYPPRNFGGCPNISEACSALCLCRRKLRENDGLAECGAIETKSIFPFPAIWRRIPAEVRLYGPALAASYPVIDSVRCGVRAKSSQLPPAPAQPAGPAPASSTPAIPSANRQITLDVQVTDKSGAPIRGLQQDDFTLLDDKQPQKIVSFQVVDGATPAAGDPSVEIVLVVDAVNASFDTVTYGRDQIKKFLQQNGGQLARPVGLIVFSDGGTKVMKGSSRDGNALAALLDQYETGLRSITQAQGFYGAAERFELSLKAIDSFVASEGKLPGRKLMIWISPGWPLLSGRNVDLSSKNEQAIFNSIVADSSALSEARITLVQR